jgi:hypothetical protein
MANITLNQSKKLFLTQSCLKEQKTLDYILKVIAKHNFPEKNIIKGIDMDVVNSGDYLVRCLDDAVHIFEIQLTLPFGFTTNLLGNL